MIQEEQYIQCYCTQNPLSCPIIVKSVIEVRRHINIKEEGLSAGSLAQNDDKYNYQCTGCLYKQN